MSVFCKDCGHSKFTLTGFPHVCPPLWDIWCPDNGEEREDVRPIRAFTADAAVSGWAERYDADSAEYDIAQGETYSVEVRRRDKPSEDDGTWTVTGETVPSYSAHRAAPERLERENAELRLRFNAPREATLETKT